MLFPLGKHNFNFKLGNNILNTDATLRVIMGLFILVIGVIFIHPVLALNSASSGIINESQFYTITQPYAISSGLASNNQIDTVRIPFIENFPTVYSVQYFASHVVTKSGGSIPSYGVYVSTNNTEPLPIELKDSFNRVIASGDILWSVDNFNNIVLAMSFNSWDIKNLTGSQNLHVNWINPSDKDKIYFITDGGGFRGPEDNSNPQAFNIEFYARDYSFPANTRVISYSDSFEVSYTRGTGVYADAILVNHISLYIVNPSRAQVQMFSKNSTGIWNKVYDTTGINEDLWSFVTGSPERLSIINPITNNEWDYEWEANIPQNSITLNIDKGLTSSDYLNIFENVQSQWNYNGNINDIGYVNWMWSKGSSMGISLQVQNYRYNSSILGWERYDSPSGTYPVNYVSEIRHHIINFMYSDSDTNWSGSSSPHNYVWVSVWDKNGNSIDQKTLYVYVGNENLNPQTRISLQDVYNHYLTNGQLWVYDNTTSTYILNGISVNTGSVLVNTPIGHYYFVSATIPDFSFTNAFYDYYDPYHAGYQISSKSDGGSKFTVISGGIKDDVLFFSTTGLNETYFPHITFHVIDDYAKAPLPAAWIYVSPSDGSNNIAGLKQENLSTNMNGYDTAVLCADGTQYNYIASHRGYYDVIGNFTASQGLLIEINMFNTRNITGTETLSPTPTPTTGTGNPLFDWFLNINIEQIKLIIGAIIILGFAFVCGYYMEQEIAPLIGAGIGFVIVEGLGLWPIFLAVLLIIILIGLIILKVVNRE